MRLHSVNEAAIVARDMQSGGETTLLLTTVGISLKIFAGSWVELPGYIPPLLHHMYTVPAPAEGFADAC